MFKEVICRNCGFKFILTEKDSRFYDEQGWETPKRCSCCREKARQEKASPYYGIEEAQVNYTPCKKRRQRVHYRPHLVEGFQ